MSNGHHSVLRRLGAFVRALNVAWTIAGVTALILLLLEGGFRVRAMVEANRSEARAALDPRTGLPWWEEFNHDFDATRKMRWASYVYFRRVPEYRGRYVSIDSASRRITPQPTAPVTPVVRVYFFGGSTMWGTSQRDSQTIAAVASRRLQELAPDGERVEVTNLGENGHVSTQEIIQLLLELRAGNRPDVVVFYDGVNDAGATVQSGAAGLPQNETKRAVEFALGRAIDRTGFERGLRKDARALARLASLAVQQSALVDWVSSRKPAETRPLVGATEGAQATANAYASNARLVEALARQYGFIPIYVWQPNLHSTKKVLSSYEQRVMQSMAADPFQRRLQDVHHAIPSLLDSAMAGVAPGRFINATGLFAGDTTHIYVDRVGHTMEVANHAIVEAFWPALEAAVTQRTQRATALVDTLDRSSPGE
jgi:lysophospholipase L1-like esterase